MEHRKYDVQLMFLENNYTTCFYKSFTHNWKLTRLLLKVNNYYYIRAHLDARDFLIQWFFLYNGFILILYRGFSYTERGKNYFKRN